MKDMSIEIYARDHVYLDVIIKDNELTIISNVFGEYDSEKTYSFTKEQTEKLFRLISLEHFIKSCRERDIEWMEVFLRNNDIKPATHVWVS